MPSTGLRGHNAEVNRILNVLVRASSGLRAPDEATCRLAGQLRHRAKSDDGIDALVAAAAALAGGPCVLLTSDPTDLTRLLADDPQVEIRTV